MTPKYLVRIKINRTKTCKCCENSMTYSTEHAEQMCRVPFVETLSSSPGYEENINVVLNVCDIPI